MSLEVRMESIVTAGNWPKRPRPRHSQGVPFLYTSIRPGSTGRGLDWSGCLVSTTTAAATSTLPYGWHGLLIGLVFSLGLILVVVAGAELFTGNNLTRHGRGPTTRSAPWRSWRKLADRLTWETLLGQLGRAVLFSIGKQYTAGRWGRLGKPPSKDRRWQIKPGASYRHWHWASLCKTDWSAWQSGLTYQPTAITDKILAIIFPVTAFRGRRF